MSLRDPLLASSLSEALAEPRFTYTTARYVASMSIQKEFDVRNPPSDRLSVVEGKHNSATRCANLQCSKELLYLREGSLRLLELESDSDDQSPQDDGAFAMKPLRSKFFWLCGECSKTHIVKQWTTSGLVLVLRNQKTAGGRAQSDYSCSRRNDAATSGVTDCPAPYRRWGIRSIGPLRLCCGEIFLAQRQADRENRLQLPATCPKCFLISIRSRFAVESQSGRKRSSIGRLLDNSTIVLPQFRRKSRRT